MKSMFVSEPGVPKTKPVYRAKEEPVHTYESPKINDARRMLEQHRDILIRRFGEGYADHPLFDLSIKQLIGGRAIQSVLLDLQGH